MAGLLDAFKQYIADALPGGLLNPETKPVANQAKYIGGLLDPNSPISQDAQNWHKRTQIGLADQLSGRQTPEAEQAYQTMMQAVGMAPLGIIAKGNFPEVLYRGTNGSNQRITGGIGEGLLFATPQERVAKMYGPNIEKIGVNPDANILIEGTKEFADVTGRRRGKIINNMRKGENMKTAADDVIERAKALGFDAVDFNSMEDLGTAIINQSKFRRGQ